MNEWLIFNIIVHFNYVFSILNILSVSIYKKSSSFSWKYIESEKKNRRVVRDLSIKITDLSVKSLGVQLCSRRFSPKF